MFNSRYLPLTRGILLGAALAVSSSAAFAQNRTFSFAYDQPKNSGYGIAAELFSKKLAELGSGLITSN
jgi:TRAP-type transport system periplasmic protein